MRGLNNLSIYCSINDSDHAEIVTILVPSMALCLYQKTGAAWSSEVWALRSTRFLERKGLSENGLERKFHSCWHLMCVYSIYIIYILYLALKPANNNWSSSCSRQVPLIEEVTKKPSKPLNGSANRDGHLAEVAPVWPSFGPTGSHWEPLRTLGNHGFSWIFHGVGRADPSLFEVWPHDWCLISREWGNGRMVSY